MAMKTSVQMSTAFLTQTCNPVDQCVGSSCKNVCRGVGTIESQDSQ